MSKVKPVIWKTMVIAGIALLTAYYYYYLHFGFTPSGEELLLVWDAYQHLEFGESFGHSILWQIFYIPPVYLFGLSFKSLRVSLTLQYVAVSVIGLFLALPKTKAKERYWFSVPVYIILMVLVHVGNSVYFGASNERIRQYPLDFHVFPLMLALISLCFVQLYFNNKGKIVKIIAGFALALSVIIGILGTDILYIVFFLVPLLIVLFRKGFYRVKDKEKVVIGVTTGCAVLLLILRVIYYFTPYLGELFSIKSIRYGEWGAAFYGAPNFVRIEELGTQILNYIGAISGLFNIDISGQAVLSIHIFNYGVRLILLFLICIVIRFTLLQWWRRENNENLDYVSIIAALGIVLLSLAFIFTSYGAGRDCVRYLGSILSFSTILLCRNFTIVEQFIKRTFKLDVNKYKYLIMGILAVGIFVYAVPKSEMKKNPDIWDDEYQEIIEIIRENDLGVGISSLWTAPIISCLSEGEAMIQSAEVNPSTGEFRLLRPLKNVNYKYRYILAETNRKEWYEFDYERIAYKLGKPQKIYQTGRFSIYVFDFNIVEKLENDFMQN